MKQIATLATMMLAALSLSMLLSPWRPSPKLHIEAIDYVTSAVSGMAALFSDPAAVVIVLVCCGFWRVTAAPALAGAVYAPVLAVLKYGTWSAMGLSFGKQALAACAAGALVCSLAAMIAALVTALSVLSQEQEQEQAQIPARALSPSRR